MVVVAERSAVSDFSFVSMLSKFQDSKYLREIVSGLPPLGYVHGPGLYWLIETRCRHISTVNERAHELFINTIPARLTRFEETTVSNGFPADHLTGRWSS